MGSLALRTGLVVALVLGAAPVRALDVILDYQYDESGFFDDPARRAVLERAVREVTQNLDGDLGALPGGEWAAVFPHPGRRHTVVYRDLDVERSTLRIFVGAQAREGGEPVRGIPGYAAWFCETPDVPGACADSAAQHSAAEQRDWLLRFAFRGDPAAAAWPPRAFRPWGGALSFASDVDWYVGLEGPVPPGKIDLLSSTVHALGHILGVGTSRVWAVRAARGHFEGAQVERLGGTAAVSADAMHFVDEETDPRPAFAAPVGPGQRALLTALDEAALRDLGWSSEVASDPSADVELKGDVDGDGRVELGDLLALEAYLAATASDGAVSAETRTLVARVEARRYAADVAPLVNGNAVGDGQLDQADAAVLRAAVTQLDADGDGIPTALENQLNERFAPAVGSLLYQPLGRGSDACAGAADVVPLLFFAANGRLVPFCGADGKAWFDVPFARPPVVVEHLNSASAVTRSAGGVWNSLPLGLPTGPLAHPVSFGSWSLRPDVSPELYLEIVRAEEHRALEFGVARVAAEISAVPSMAGASATAAGSASARAAAAARIGGLSQRIREMPAAAAAPGSSAAIEKTQLEPDAPAPVAEEVDVLPIDASSATSPASE